VKLPRSQGLVGSHFCQKLQIRAVDVVITNL
jgi:hypothetical protein